MGLSIIGLGLLPVFPLLLLEFEPFWGWWLKLRLDAGPLADFVGGNPIKLLMAFDGGLICYHWCRWGGWRLLSADRNHFVPGVERDHVA